MAVTPAETAYTEEELQLMKKIEDWIDNDLLRFHLPGSHTREVELESESFVPREKNPNDTDYEDMLHWIGQRLLPEVVHRFKNAGWNVKHTDNKDYTHILTLTPKQ